MDDHIRTSTGFKNGVIIGERRTYQLRVLAGGEFVLSGDVEETKMAPDLSERPA
jgi:hypothetical protein